MKSQILSIQLNVSEKKLLRDYYNGLNNTSYKSITPINSRLGFSDSKDTYDLLKQLYNHDIEVENKVIRRNKIIRDRRILKKQLSEMQHLGELNPVNVRILKPKMDIDKLGKYVHNWLRKREGHFEITLKSRIADVVRTFKFSSINHFDNWYDKVVGEHEVDSAGNVGNVIMPKDYELFTNLIIQDIKMVSGGCNNHKSKSIEMKSSFYTYQLFNPTSMNNNCFFACLNHIKSLGSDRYIYKKLRKLFGLELDAEVSINDAYRIAKELGYNIQIIDYDINEELDDNIQYIVCNGAHYYVLESFEQINHKDKKTKRGLLTFDFETRKTTEYDVIKATGEKLYYLKDSLCCVYYRPYKQTECKTQIFISGDKSSARQLIDWFNQESKAGRTYNVLAHNGGRFDYYFFISSLTSAELLECEMHFRATTIISINYRGHLFKDSACFLTDSLKNLSKSFKVTDGKITKFNIHGSEITSEQLCFYQPKLGFDSFIDLQNTDKDFWQLYEKYCLYDCIALFQIWEKFSECVNSMIEKVSPYLLSKCPLMASTTIGSHSKKIIVEVNKYSGKINKYKEDMELFAGISYDKKQTGDVKVFGAYLCNQVIDYKKYNFLCKFKRGGISHSHKMGMHYTGITGVDIASQYPASLIYSMIPTGKSEWVEEYEKYKYGFYWIKNCKFNSYKLKPVANSISDLSLDWATNDMNELYVDSYMLAYLMDNYGLVKFDVVKGLVSNKEISSRKIFGRYIETFYEEKKLQDKYKADGNALYNEALRSTIKLYLNSLTGKLVENPARHFSLKFDDTSLKTINGQGIKQTFNKEKVNDWIVAGIMVYSYSKRLLFEYIKCLPNNSDDVIHIETDGIYFSSQLLGDFSKNLNQYKGDYPCKFGEDLGNLKIEKTTEAGQVAYYLGKKFYCITMEDGKNIMRIKGIPQKTIAEDGSEKVLVDVPLYETIYSGSDIPKSFQTLKKSLFCDNTRITAYEMTRTIKSDKGSYNLYVPTYKYMQELRILNFGGGAKSCLTTA